MTLKQRLSTHKPSKKWMIMMTFLGITIIIGLIYSIKLYNCFFAPNITTDSKEAHYIYIHNNATIEEVFTLIEREKILIKSSCFKTTAQWMSYADNIKPGRYLISNGMSNHALVSLLRSGQQTPVNFTFNNIRTPQDLARVTSLKLMTDSIELISLLNNAEYLKKYDLTPSTALSMFIPNSYQIYWNTDANGFIERMHKEYKRFWNEKRRQLAKSANLTQIETSILASIVDEETQKNDEKPIVAGLYLNRLRKGILLQADPTVKFAVGDFTIKRILKKDLEIDSPYNTYKYAGLPPGPIRIPSISGIDAVLNATKHEYYYMCAKEDFSGYHNFSKSLDQHNQNAAKYRRALKSRNIMR